MKFISSPEDCAAAPFAATPVTAIAAAEETSKSRRESSKCE
ncbi:hypothetical protein X971_4175 [Agrobacterium tumefaciens LBA4213 (Ach5)]|nr:hypothetical protein X971_4175 [Agrobacterium tumefaciens LBA4213 (Ach5)]